MHGAESTDIMQASIFEKKNMSTTITYSIWKRRSIGVLTASLLSLALNEVKTLKFTTIYNKIG